jgi:NAD(P)H-hydrate repair Nnr-like enzyme with NAD(P)H-hydrate dehydratase domain
VLTPHARELDRIAGPGTYAGRAERVPELAARLGVTVVAKGPGTMIATPDRDVQVVAFDEPALATAGTGDVLAGMLGAALAALAAREGQTGPGSGVAGGLGRHIARTVWWHAAAGRAAGARTGGRTDAVGVLGALPTVLHALGAASLKDLPLDPGPSGRLWIDRLLALDVADMAGRGARA